MKQNILIETFGEKKNNLNVLGFFLERPFHTFTKTQVAKFLNISQDSVRDNIRFFRDRDFIKEQGSHGPYALNCNHPMVRTIIECTDSLGETFFQIYIKPNISESTNENETNTMSMEIPSPEAYSGMNNVGGA